MQHWRMLIDAGIYRGPERVQTCSSLHEALEARGQDQLVWVRLQDPGETDLAALAAQLDLPDLVTEDVTHAHQRPKLERYGDLLFCVLKPAVYDDATDEVNLGEVHVLVTPQVVVTVRHGRLGDLDRARSDLEASGLLASGPAAVLHAVCDVIVDAYLPIVRELERDIDEIERDVFSAGDQIPIERIYHLKREVLDFHQATGSLVTPLADLAQGRVAAVPAALHEHFRDVYDHLRYADDRVAAFRELLTSVLQANLALVGLHENAQQRKISAWAAMALVPTIVGSIYGMNFQHMPELDETFAYPAALGVIVMVVLLLFWRFRRNGWL